MGLSWIQYIFGFKLKDNQGIMYCTNVYFSDFIYTYKFLIALTLSFLVLYKFLVKPTDLLILKTHANISCSICD